MGINFPNAPATNDLWPSPPVAGQPVYLWDGEKWTTQGASATKQPIYADGSIPMTAQLKLIAPPVAPADAVAKSYVDAIGSVRYDQVQALAEDTLPAVKGTKTQGRQNIYAAPFDALAYNGLQFNGAFDVSQQWLASSVAVSVGGNYTVDGWLAAASGGSVSAQQLNGGVPSGANGWFGAALGITAGTAVPNAAGTYAYVLQNIEGYRIARLAWGTANAQPITIGFWIFPSVSGTMSVAIRTGSGASRSYITDVPVTALIWQYKTVTVPGDIGGTWARDYTAGLQVLFSFAAGSTYQTAAGAWTVGNFIGSANATNLLGANGNYVYLMGVSVLPGLEAPSAARSPSIMRQYDQEVLLAKRYYNNNLGVAWEAQVINGGDYGWSQPFPVPMRLTPTLQANDNTSLNMGAPVSLNMILGGSGFEYRKRASATGSGNLFSLVTADARF